MLMDDASITVLSLWRGSLLAKRAASRGASMLIDGGRALCYVG